MGERIECSNPNVIYIMVYHDTKILNIAIKNGTKKSIDDDEEIQELMKFYKKKKYDVGIAVSGTEDPEVVMMNILNYQLEKLIKANARV